MVDRRAHASWFQKPYSIYSTYTYVRTYTLCMYRSQNVGNNTQRPFSDSDNNKRHAFSTHAGPPPLLSFGWLGGGSTPKCVWGEGGQTHVKWTSNSNGWKDNWDILVLLANARLDFQYSQRSELVDSIHHPSMNASRQYTTLARDVNNNMFDWSLTRH